jgi:chemotaxis protein CheX
MASPASDNAALMTSWRATLFDAASEVFAMMVGAKLFRAAAGQELPRGVNVTGTVGIAGAVRAVLSLRCGTETATKIASHMLGISPAEAAAQNCDAIGEVCNMAAGQFKTRIGFEAECMLTVPTVITGSDYRVHSAAQGTRLEMAVLYDGEPISIALDIPK